MMTHLLGFKYFPLPPSGVAYVSHQDVLHLCPLQMSSSLEAYRTFKCIYFILESQTIYCSSLHFGPYFYIVVTF